MAAITSTATNTPVRDDSVASSSTHLWLRNRRWDLMFITFSVIVVPLPYLVYLFARDILGVDADVARNAVNGFVAVAVGGPHMMSTFLRTGLDDTFTKRYPMLIRSSIIIPIIVISLAFLNLTLLLTVFFFWASLHVLHQITYIVELYNHKEHRYVRPKSKNSVSESAALDTEKPKRKNSAVSWQARMIDYSVILTCLFPMAALRISQGTFEIGTNDLGRVIPDFFEQTWFFVLMSSVFFVALSAFIVKSVREYREGLLNWPKTVFMVFTIIIAFSASMLDNLDTAFQGLNTWHSFQYLAITFYIIKIRQEYGTLKDDAPLVARFSRRAKDSRGLYLLSALMLGGSLVIFLLVYAITGVVKPGIEGNAHFDTAYYTAILSFLWIHYFHDHFLFTDFESLDAAYGHD